MNCIEENNKYMNKGGCIGSVQIVKMTVRYQFYVPAYYSYH